MDQISLKGSAIALEHRPISAAADRLDWVCGRDTMIILI